jgi:hypothetical protein
MEVDRLKSDFAFHPVTSDEVATLQAMLDTEPTSRVMLMPTHHISQHGDMMGFRYDCVADRAGGVLPVSRAMFSGHTATECLDDDAAIMQLICTPEENRIKMAEFMAEIKASENPPDLTCIPDNATVITQSGFMHATDLRSVDCKPWAPELPESIGLYHAYIRGFNRDVRVHKLFIICSGGCPKASDEFCNMIIDLNSECTAAEIAESEEAWWLKRACQRSRCRLIKMLADKFGVRVQCVDDVLAYTRTRDSRQELLAVPTTDTVEHDICKRDRTTVSVHNLCVDTTRVTNGILCQMHPSEGYWLFRGAPRGAGVNGAMFGSHRMCGAFPTRSPVIPPQSARHMNAVVVNDGKEIVRPEAFQKPSGKQHHMCFDEAFFKNLERMQWNRDNGFVELIPIVVGMQ